MLPALVLGAALCAALPAGAEQVVYGPDGAPTVVQHKKYPLSARWESSLLFSTGLNDALTSHLGAVLEQTYHPNEWLDLGLDLVLNKTSLSGLTDQIRGKLPDSAPRTKPGPPVSGNTGSELAHASQLQAGGLAQVRIAPIYGKVDLAGELAVHFQAFVTAGAGAGYVHHESVNLCAVAGAAACQPGQFQVSNGVKPLGDLGGGLRFYLGQHASLEGQLRAYLYPDTVRDRVDLSAGEAAQGGQSHTVLAVLATLLVGVSVVY
jgi:outer membrane beta-barrel protein